MKNKGWIYVFLTCLFELMWLYGFNEASTWWHWAIVIGIILIDFHFLPKACETLPTGTVYAVFAGVGTIGTALMDSYLFGGSFSLGKIVFIAILILGVIGLNIADNKEEKRAAKEAI
ncbi:QacE family quaternary ammonium compound efflux SMR transporter [Cytobacillus depressus]|uniref:QacE family quaternary ammonium compound efflux SMR transporter n=1 Tax=Cytobacillus depressus TaxID=1602942 RepID=A0A6L3V216_9BACI|nr:SMR family transporter [Cytobacillus depressus]KAB2329983.1 QacE family quaternary ammonium compound efflux SMR transporter [Cytobacillus depressus]